MSLFSLKVPLLLNEIDTCLLLVIAVNTIVVNTIVVNTIALDIIVLNTIVINTIVEKCWSPHFFSECYNGMA